MVREKQVLSNCLKVGFGCCSIHSRSRAQGNTKALWDGWEEKGLRAGGWELGGEGRGPCEEEAPAPNGKKIVKPDHAVLPLLPCLSFSALLFGLPTGRSKVSQRRQVGQALSLFLSLSLALSSSMIT